MKRFYKNVRTEKSEGGFVILLDERTLRTPAGKIISTSKKLLAEAIAAEWEAQTIDIQPRTMPLMRLAATALDHLPGQREAMTERLLAYVDSDLLCLRADMPSELRARQDEQWQKPLEWLKRTHGLELKIGTGLKIPSQPPHIHDALARKLAALEDNAFIGLHEAAASSGSLVLALALAEGALKPEEVFALAELESLFQMERWGVDAEAEKRHAAIRTELQTLAQWFELVTGDK